MNGIASRYLGWSLVLACVLVTAGSMLIALSHRELQTKRAEFEQASSTIHELRERYQRTASDEATIRATIGRFNGLLQQGLIGPENRLDWADELRAIRDTRRIPKIEFELVPQRVLSPLDSRGEYTLTASQMKLQAGLLHEGDLLRLLADLRNTRGALVVPRSCDLEHATPSHDNDDSITLQAHCALDWITIQQNTLTDQVTANKP
ncbi:MAG TPA: hypothetical protein VFW00_03560 [Rhodocyclaceae bacterium]|nr:hypothetical protein [Rhodocyclaceae bacterium]